MGNVIMLINSRKRVKLMKIDGETLKLKPPLRVRDVVQRYPNHVVMDSESVRRLGTKSRPLDGDHVLKAGAKKLYFLVELQKLPEERVPRRVRSAGIQIGAKERLESLMLSKRSASDLTFVKAPGGSEEGGGGGVMRVKMRVTKSQLAKLMQEGAQGQEMAEKIIGMCLNKKEEESKPNVKFTTAGTTGSLEGSRSGNLGMWDPGLRSTEESACRNTARLQGDSLSSVSITGSLDALHRKLLVPRSSPEIAGGRPTPEAPRSTLFAGNRWWTPYAGSSSWKTYKSLVEDLRRHPSTEAPSTPYARKRISLIRNRSLWYC